MNQWKSGAHTKMHFASKHKFSVCEIVVGGLFPGQADSDAFALCHAGLPKDYRKREDFATSICNSRFL